MKRLARADPVIAVAVVAFCGVLLHEILYQLSDGTDFPFVLVFSGTRVLEISHGGMDSMAVGLLAIGTLLVLRHAREQAGGRR